MTVYKVRRLSDLRFVEPPKTGRIYTNKGHIKTSFGKGLSKRTDIEIVEFRLDELRTLKPDEI